MAIDHFDFKVWWDRDYGIDHRRGWSVTINGVVYVEFSRSLIVALVKAWWRRADSELDMARQRRRYAREAKARAARCEGGTRP